MGSASLTYPLTYPTVLLEGRLIGHLESGKAGFWMTVLLIMRTTCMANDPSTIPSFPRKRESSWTGRVKKKIPAFAGMTREGTLVMIVVGIAVLAYLLDTIPFGLLLTRAAGLEVAPPSARARSATLMCCVPGTK